MASDSVTLPIGMARRRWAVGEHSGDVFGDGQDFSGLTVTIEIRDDNEAAAVAMALLDPDAVRDRG